MAPIETLEQVVQSSQTQLSQEPAAHANLLRNLAKKQGGNLILGSLLPVAPPTPVADDAPTAGEAAAPAEPPIPPQNDPLDIIDPVHCTIACLFIL